jgi:hypothetical protein
MLSATAHTTETKGNYVTRMGHSIGLLYVQSSILDKTIIKGLKLLVEFSDFKMNIVVMYPKKITR